ncbi:MAG TPA: YihY/virulence factor BrkB family protein [bacterium]|nr:YihY/virulence factor BrkB family protein [bacterium]
MKAIVWATGKVLSNGNQPRRGQKRLYASSLAFKTSLALVPALAILMAVLSNDHFSQQREQLLDQIVDAIYPVQTQSTNSVLDPSEPKNLQELNQLGKQEIRLSMRKFTFYSQKVGFVGFLGFLLIVFLLLRDVEHSFNYLWEVERPRRLLPQMVRHATFFIGLPLMGVFLLTLRGWAGSLSFLQTSFHHWLFTEALPFGALWAACAWMYVWIPNAKVDVKSAALTGLITALLLQTGRWGMNWYTLKVFSRSHVYGALWTIPVILIWFYVSWIILLFGAEVTFFVQQHRTQKA